MLILEEISHDDLKNTLKEFYNYASKQLNLSEAPKLVFLKDQQNADNILGNTGFYDPKNKKISLYITNRHAKDVLRSFSHELVHHAQNCDGKMDDETMSMTENPSYASEEGPLRELERDAFERGNMIFRDWCDMKKTDNNLIKENKMKETKPKEQSEQQIVNPYPELFKKEERLMGERLSNHEDILYQELVKRAIEKK